MAKVFVISDTHFPFHNKKAFKKVMNLIAKEQPTYVIQIGDLLDQYAFSKYSKTLNINPKKELTQGLKYAKDMWVSIQKSVKGVKCIQLVGNHDVRMAKRISEKLPELSSIVDPMKLYRFKGVHLVASDRGYVDIEGVRYLHGYLSKSLDHAHKQGKPVVHGHRHRPCIETGGRNIWSMDVGFLGDERLLPFNYTQSKTTNWTLGAGIVEDDKPRLIFL